MRGRLLFVFIPVLLLSGCAGSLERQQAFNDVEATAAQRLSQRVHWYQGTPEDAEVRQFLEQHLNQPLTPAGAIQVALLNNQHLQSEYASLGIAQADLVQAGLLSNPTLFSSIRFPSGGGRSNLEFEIAQSFLDVLLRPARQRLAQAEFERVRLSVSHRVLDFSAEVLIAFREVQAARQLVGIFEVLNESSQAGYELAQRFDEAGNISPLKLSRHRAVAAESRSELQEAQFNLQSRRDALSKLMGLTGDQRHWQLAETLPELPDEELLVDDIVEQARQQRLDLGALHRERDRLQQALEMTRDYRYIGGAEFGINAERETDGSSLIGPNFAIEVPLFDQKQAQIARLESLLQGNLASIAALESDIENDVTDSVHRLRALRRLIEHYRTEMIPAGEQMVTYLQQEQNYMLVDVFDLLLGLRQARGAYRGYIKNLRDYWIARAQLQQRTGAAVIALAAARNREVTP